MVCVLPHKSGPVSVVATPLPLPQSHITKSYFSTMANSGWPFVESSRSTRSTLPRCTTGLGAGSPRPTTIPHPSTGPCPSPCPTPRSCSPTAAKADGGHQGAGSTASHDAAAATSPRRHTGRNGARTGCSRAEGQSSHRRAGHKGAATSTTCRSTKRQHRTGRAAEEHASSGLEGGFLQGRGTQGIGCGEAQVTASGMCGQGAQTVTLPPKCTTTLALCRSPSRAAA
jgi:hypothetical protein